MENPDLTSKVDLDLTEKRKEAEAALAGAEWTAKHEKEAQAKARDAESETIKNRLAQIAEEKTKLELNWIELDNERREIRTVLNPLLDEEKKMETEEATLEAEEAKIGLPTDKQVVEKKRHTAQKNRQQVEQKKWGEEDKLAKIEATIQTNTTQYRALLDEEEKAEKRLTQIKLEGTSTETNG